MALLGSLLSAPVHFPFHPKYQFPLILFMVTFLDGILLVHIIHAIYEHFERRVFAKRVRIKQVVLFVATCLLAIAAYYPLFHFIVNYIHGSTFELYAFIVSFLASLLIVTLFIVLFYGRKFIELLTIKKVEDSIKIKSGRRIYYVPVNEIKYFFSQNKTVFMVNFHDEKVSTDFTLNELENILDTRIFFRANRQFLIQSSAVSSVSPSSNDKLEVILSTEQIKNSAIIISRYKALKFKKWFIKS